MHRKVVTVLFCDVVGSTALGESVDPEALQGLLARYFERMKAIVESHGGSVEKFIGDAVMAVFGVPQVHEDDALRACRAAVEMRAAFPELGVQGRIGVNTGEVVTGTEERLAAGDAVNVAARLQQAAQPDEVLIGQASLALVRRAVESEPVEPLELKGKAEPVPAHRLLSLLKTPERSHEARFVGRERELTLIQTSWERARSEARCELLTVVGEAGVGKSRLVAKALPLIDCRAVSGRCLPYGEGITYWPLVEVIRQLNALPSDPAAAASIRSLLGESEEATSAEEIAWAFRKLLEEQAPLVVLFDDIQWAEEAFLDLVEAAALLTRDGPLLLLCMARPELIERRASWPAPIRLEPLAADEAEELLPDTFDHDLRARIAHAAGGNPLFLTEMVAMASEAEGEVAVPVTLRALLAARLDQLEPDERSVLERGAVEGEIFHRGAVQALSPNGQVTPRLAALARKGLIRPEKAQLPGEEAFRFHHLLLRDAAYDALPKSVRADLHERFADWLEQHGPQLVELDELLGYHLEQSARYLSELGADDDATRSLAHEAAARLGAAASRAFVRRDAQAAVSLMSRAVALLPGDDSARVDLVPNVRVVQGLSGDMSWAEGVLVDTVAAAAAADDRRLEAHAQVQLAFVRLFTRPDVAAGELHDVATWAVGVFEELGDELGLARAWRLTAQAHYLDRKAGLCAEASAEALEHARLTGDELEKREIVEWLCVALMLGPTPAPEAARRCEGLLEETQGDPILEPTVLSVLSNARAMQGHLEEAHELLERWRRGVTEFGDSIWLFGVNFGMVALAGDPVAAERELRPGYEALGRLGEKSHFSSVAGLLSRVVCAQGRYEEAERLSRESEEAARPNDIHSHILWRITRSEVFAQRGDLERAEGLALEAVAFAAQSDFLDSHADALMNLAELRRQMGRNQKAATHIQEALRLYEQKGNILSAERARSLATTVSLDEPR